MSTTTLTILGCTFDSDVYYCQTVATHMIPLLSETFGITLIVNFDIVLEIEYLKQLAELKKTLGSQLYNYKASHVVLRDGNVVVGDKTALLNLALNEFNQDMSTIEYNQTLITLMAEQETKKALKGTGAVYLQYKLKPLDGEPEVPMKKIVIQLATDCPVACENFIKLCTGEMGVIDIKSKKTALNYKNCPIHRIVPAGWFQCGDIVDGSGVHSIAAIGEENKVQDESLSADFSSRGMVGFTSSGPHSNGSQFFITLGSCPWMNHKYVGVGRVVQGFETLNIIENEPLKNQKPIHSIIVESCGREVFLVV